MNSNARDLDIGDINDADFDLLAEQANPLFTSEADGFGNEEDENDDDFRGAGSVSGTGEFSADKMGALFGENVDTVWRKRRRKGHKQQYGRTTGKRLPPEISGPLSEANLHFVNGDYNQALERLSHVIKTAPRLADPYYTMGLIFVDIGEQLKAIQFFILAAELSPPHLSKDIWLRIRDTALDLKEYNQALDAIRRLMKLDPSPSFRAQKILLTVELGRPELAQNMLRHFLVQYPDEIDVLADFGDACERSGSIGRAIAAYLRLAFHIMGTSGVPPSLLDVYNLQSWNHLGQSLNVVELDKLFFVVRNATDLLLQWEEKTRKITVTQHAPPSLASVDPSQTAAPSARTPAASGTALSRYLNDKAIVSESTHMAIAVTSALVSYLQRLRASVPSVNASLVVPAMPMDIALLYGTCRLKLRNRASIASGLRILLPILAKINNTPSPSTGAAAAAAAGLQDNSGSASQLLATTTATDVDSASSPEAEFDEQGAQVIAELTGDNIMSLHPSAVSSDNIRMVTRSRSSPSKEDRARPAMGGDGTVGGVDTAVDEIEAESVPAVEAGAGGGAEAEALEAQQDDTDTDTDMDTALFLMRQKLRIAAEISQLGLISLAEKTVTSAVAQLESLPMSKEVQLEQWLKAAAAYEGVGRFDDALSCTARAIELDANHPEALYRFSSLVTAYKPELTESSSRLLAMHFLTLLTEFETGRQEAINVVLGIEPPPPMQEPPTSITRGGLSGGIDAVNVDSGVVDTEVSLNIAILEAAASVNQTLETGVAAAAAAKRTTTSTTSTQLVDATATEESELNPANLITTAAPAAALPSPDETMMLAGGDAASDFSVAPDALLTTTPPADIVAVVDYIAPDTSKSTDAANKYKRKRKYPQKGGDNLDGKDDSEDIYQPPNKSTKMNNDNHEKIDDPSQATGVGIVVAADESLQLQQQQQEPQVSLTETEAEVGEAGVAVGIEAGVIESDEILDRAVAADAAYQQRSAVEINISTRKLSPWLIKYEVRSLMEWAPIVYASGDVKSYCCIMIPIIFAWMMDHRGIKHLPVDEAVYISQLQTSQVAINYKEQPWIDATQNCMWRLVMSLCECVDVGMMINRQMVRNISLQCQHALSDAGVWSRDDLQPIRMVLVRASIVRVRRCFMSRQDRALGRSAAIALGAALSIQSRKSKSRVSRSEIAEEERVAGGVDMMISGVEDVSVGAAAVSADDDDDDDDFDSDDDEVDIRNIAILKSLKQSYEVDQTRRLVATLPEEQAALLSATPFHRRPISSVYFLDACAAISAETAAVARPFIINPYDITAANRLARTVLCEPEIRGPSTGAIDVRLPVQDLVLSNPRCLSAVILGGHQASTGRKHAVALSRYLDAFRLDPTQPLTALCIATHTLFLSQHALVKEKHETLLKAFAFLEHYKTQRLRHTIFRRGFLRSVEAVEALVAAAAQKQNNSDQQGSSDSSTGNIGSSSNCSSSSSSNSSNKSSIELLSELGVLQEVHFNFARSFDELKLYHLAVDHYNIVLRLSDTYPAIVGPMPFHAIYSPDKWLVEGQQRRDHRNGSRNPTSKGTTSIATSSSTSIATSSFSSSSTSSSTSSSSSTSMDAVAVTGTGSYLNVTREAAHNLILILKRSGASDLALEIMMKYLVY